MRDEANDNRAGRRSPVPAPPTSLRGVSSPAPASDRNKPQKKKRSRDSDATSKRADTGYSRGAPRGGDVAVAGGRLRSRLNNGAPLRPKKRSFWPRKLKFTREGKYFLGITLGIGFAAINTGNNLLYMLLGLMLSLIIVSGVMSELSLRNLTVKRRLPARAQVARSHLVEIEVYNNKETVPSYAIEVEDLRAGQPADKRCFFLKISPRSTQIAAYRRTPRRRGSEAHTGFRIATRFPFGLFEKSREVTCHDELVIYPAVDKIRIPARGRQADRGDAGALGRGRGDEIYSIRAKRDGDDPKDIYWRKSTVPGQQVVKERAQELHHDVDIMVDVFTEKPSDDADANEAFEARVREVASQAVAHVRRGDRVTLKTNARHRVVADRGRGLDPLLRFLALLDQRPAPDPTDTAKTIAKTEKRPA